MSLTPVDRKYHIIYEGIRIRTWDTPLIYFKDEFFSHLKKKTVKECPHN
jgi:hypothetical protein